MRRYLATHPGLETLAGLGLNDEQLHKLLVMPHDLAGNPIPENPSLVHRYPDSFPHVALVCRMCLTQRAQRRVVRSIRRLHVKQ